MQLFAAFGLVATLVAAVAVGTRLLWIARRTLRAPEGRVYRAADLWPIGACGLLALAQACALQARLADLAAQLQNSNTAPLLIWNRARR